MKNSNSFDRIVILSHILRFPNGLGASARVANYATGLSALGVPVTILCLKPYEPAKGPILNPLARGKWGEAEFVYTCGTSIVAEQRWRRLIQNILGLVGAIRYIGRLRKNDDVGGILYYGIGYSIVYTFLGWVLSRWLNVPFVGESTEEPFVYSKPSIWTKLQKVVFWQVVVKFFDGIVVISKHLERSFKQAIPSTPVKLIPVIVDISRFNNKFDTVSRRNITFCGSLVHVGEVEMLLEAWASIYTDFSDYRLYLVGDATTSRMENLKDKIKLLGIENHVIFGGLVARDAIPAILQNSAVLVLPRPSGVFSTAGLPNKLGEYLASGRPVLCTMVGDIPLYLRDSENAFLVDPGNVELFAQRLRWILANLCEAEQVGIRGRHVAETVFGLEVNSRRLLSLFQELRNRNVAKNSKPVKSSE